MALSEHEQRLLDQIERALYAEDPKFATSVRSSDLRTHVRRRTIRAVVVLLVGFVLLIVGVATNLWIGVGGFVVMLVALVLGLSAYRRLGAGNGATLRSVDGRSTRNVGGGKRRRPRAGKGRSSRTSSGGPRERLEERWKRRWEERGGRQ